MHNLIIKFERTARNGVLLVYLSALFLATATYFAGRSLGIGADFLWYVALAEAGAVEVHSFLSQRLTRELHEQIHSSAVVNMVYDARDALERRYQLHLRITIGLVTFSCLNSIAFWATIMRPVTWTDWLQVLLRGAVIPLAFLAAGFLSPLHESVESTLQDVGSDLTRVMVRHASRQWRARVRRARRRGADLAESMALLLELQEGGGAPASVMVRQMNQAIRAAEGGRSHTTLPAALTPSSPPEFTRPPTGGGTPLTQGVRTPAGADGVGAPPILLQPVRTDRAAAARAAAQERRAMRLTHIVEWLREAQSAGKPLSVRTVQMRLQKLERRRLSESTVQALILQAQERLAAEQGQAAQ